jgi:hypothetical protein
MWPAFLVCVILFSVPANAEVLNADIFQYRGGPLSYLPASSSGEIPAGTFVSVWDPSQDDSLMRAGMQITFWGRGAGCDPSTVNGPITNRLSVSDAAALTGIALDPSRQDLSWSPDGDASTCPSYRQRSAGPAFVIVNEQSGPAGGIGLYTDTGEGDPHSAATDFFRQFDERGQDGQGTNKGIEGTFVTFRFDWKKGRTVIPWKNRSGRVAIRAVQSVQIVQVGGSSAGAGSPHQVQQQFAISFINSQCMAESRGLCQLKYLFYTNVVREGVEDWSREKWFEGATLFFDPAQGSLPVFYGPLNGRGAQTFAKDAPAIGLWTSCKAATQHGSFPPTVFQVEITFDQLRHALELVSAHTLGKRLNEVSDSDVERVFGSAWDRPDAWVVLDTNVGQEAYDTDDSRRVIIGGGVREIFIKALP